MCGNERLNVQRFPSATQKQLDTAFGAHRPAHLLGHKLVHVLILRQEVVPVQPSTDPHGSNLLWSLREQRVNLFRWPLNPTQLNWFPSSRWTGGRCTYHPFAEQLEDLHEQHCGFPQRHKRFRDLPTGRMDPVSCVETSFSTKLQSRLIKCESPSFGPADMKR